MNLSRVSRNSADKPRAPVHHESSRITRLYPFYFLSILLPLLLLANLAREQLLRQEIYAEQERIQTMRRIVLPAPRGDILDRHGTLLVGNQARFAAVVYLNELRREFRLNYIRNVRRLRAEKEAAGDDSPIDFNELVWESRVEVVQELLDQINVILGRDEVINRRTFERHFIERRVLPFPLMQDLEEREYARLIEQIPPLSPIVVVTRTARFYPFGAAAAHTLGYVGTEAVMAPESMPGTDLLTFSREGQVGRAGIERQFDSELEGTPGFELWRVDPMGFQFERVELGVPLRGRDIQTSLDIEVQLAGERAFENKVGAAVALRPLTGEILAIISAPAYDLNDFTPFLSAATQRRITEDGAWLNRALQGLYPPGSTFKTLTAVAAFAAERLDPEEIINCGPFYRVGNRNFPEHSRRSFGEIDLRQALAISSNVFFYQIGLRSGINRIAETSRLFGLDRPTGVNLPFESTRSIVPDPEWKRRTQGESWFPGDTANTSIGQGFLRFTPIQMAAFVASLSRGETRTLPTILRVTDPRNVDHGGEPIDIPPAALDAIIEGMQRAAEEGTARRANLPEIGVAGKTGTAQVFPDGRRLTLAWFIGFAPVNNPEIAVAVVVEGVTEEDQFQGGLTAAPIARQMFEAYFR